MVDLPISFYGTWYQGISKLWIFFKYQHVVFGLLYGSPKLLCMNVVWF